MMQEKNDHIAETALAAVKSAGEILLKYWQENSNLAYSSKGDLSPVTHVDLEIERIIREAILKEHPSHRIVGEEYGEMGESDSPYSWYIDPIDGTKNYVRGLKFFGTQVAVLYQGEVIVGVSSAPALNETIVARKGDGAFLNGNRIYVSDVAQIEDAYVSCGNIKYFWKQDKLTNLMRVSEKCWSLRSFGDFWSYHLLASGGLDVILEAKTKIWDVAAVSLIVKEAGGIVTDFEGKEVSYNTTSIIATNPKLHAQVHSLINFGMQQ